MENFENLLQLIIITLPSGTIIIRTEISTGLSDSDWQVSKEKYWITPLGPKKRIDMTAIHGGNHDWLLEYCIGCACDDLAA